MPANTSPLHPTWHGFVSDTKEALILFEATLQGTLGRVTRRPHDRERASLIRSGAIFIYEEGASGIKRWTDGVPWSPSRILNNFLIYRELDKPFPPGEKKRAKPKPKADPFDAPVKPETSESMLSSPATPQSATTASPIRTDPQQTSADRDSTRSLVGSLTDSYSFKDDGLVKKTMSVNVNGTNFHLVSYYNPEDVKSGSLPKPMDTDLRYTQIRPALIHGQNFRAPLDDTDDAVPPSPFAPQQGSHYIGTHPAYMAGSAAYVQQPMQHAGYAQGAPYQMPHHHSHHHPPPPQPPPHPHQQHPQQQRHHDAYAAQRQGVAYTAAPQQQAVYAPMQQVPHMQQMRPEYGHYAQYSDPRGYTGQDPYHPHPNPHVPHGWPGSQG